MKTLRKMTALVLSLSMVMSLAVTGLFVGADPADRWDNATLGQLSKLYETGRVDDPGIISTVAGDSGGKSYGTYMFASNAGTPHLFAHWCKEQPTNTLYYQFGDALDTAYHTGGDGCGAYFDAVWMQLAYDYKAEFGSAQHAYVQDRFYNKLVTMVESSVQGFDIDNYSIALKNVFWSRAVQHGADGAYNVITRALAALNGFKNQSEGELIEAIYAESSKLDTNTQPKTMSGTTAKKYGVAGKSMAYYSANSGEVQLSVYRRLAVNERSDALVMLQNNGYANAPLSDGIYSLRPYTSQLLAIDYSNGLKLTDAVANGAAQKFSLVYHYGGFYTINTVATTDTASQRLAFSTDGTPTLENANTNLNQLWVIESLDGGFTLKNLATGTYLMAPSNNLVSESHAQSTATASSDSVLSTDVGAVAKTAATQAAVSFTMTKAPTGTYTVYDAADATTALTDVTATLKDSALTLTAADGDLEAAVYYVSVTPAEGSESTRVKLTVTAYVDESSQSTPSATPTVWHFASFSGALADWTMRGMIYPVSTTELHAKQSSFPVRGVISCSSPITSVNLTIEGSSINLTRTPNTTSYDLKNLDDSVTYSTLTQGNYTYVLTATAGGVTTELVRSAFTVGPELANAPSSGNDETFTVTFDAGGGTLSGNRTMTVTLDDFVYGDLPTASLSGHKFMGWYAADGTQIVASTPVHAADLTLTARYAKIYTYKFLNENGTVFDEGDAAVGELIVAPTTSPVKSPEYSFSHWQGYTAGRTVMTEGGMTFTAVYTKNSSTTPSTPGTTPSTPSGGGGGGGGGTTTTPSGSLWTVSLGTSISQMTGPVYSNGKVVTSGVLATGMTTTVDGKEYVITIKGDASGDGKITVTDVVKLQSHLLNKSSLSGAYLKAADLNGDGNVTITDLVKSARVVAGKDSIS